jgi:hypothetical protein
MQYCVVLCCTSEVNKVPPTTNNVGRSLCCNQVSHNSRDNAKSTPLAAPSIVSSLCVDVVDDVAATGAAEVVASFDSFAAAALVAVVVSDTIQSQYLASTPT